MTRLFRDLGWPETPGSDQHHRTFQCTNGVVIALYDAAHYEPALGPVADGFRGVTLCVSLASFEECVAVYETLERVDGVELLEAPTEAPWGGGFSWRDPRATSGTWRGQRAPRSTTAAGSRSPESWARCRAGGDLPVLFDRSLRHLVAPDYREGASLCRGARGWSDWPEPAAALHRDGRCRGGESW